jgi:hypothetical protein
MKFRTFFGGAGNEIRTRDTKLGKLVLYQLSYARLPMHLYKATERGCQQQLATIESLLLLRNTGNTLPVPPTVCNGARCKGGSRTAPTNPMCKSHAVGAVREPPFVNRPRENRPREPTLRGPLVHASMSRIAASSRRMSRRRAFSSEPGASKAGSSPIVFR